MQKDWVYFGPEEPKVATGLHNVKGDTLLYSLRHLGEDGGEDDTSLARKAAKDLRDAVEGGGGGCRALRGASSRPPR